VPIIAINENHRCKCPIMAKMRFLEISFREISDFGGPFLVARYLSGSVRHCVEGKNAPQEMNDWEVFHCPWYLESDGWKFCLDDNERTQFRRLINREQPETFFSSFKEANQTKAAESVFQVDAVAEKQQFYADKSRKGRPKKKVESTPKPATSKRSKFLPVLYCC
jgi:hypothetical protein